MSVEQNWEQACRPVFEKPNTPEKIFVNRITWNARMIDLLQGRKEALLNELRGIDAQIQSVTTDTKQLILDHAKLKIPDEQSF